MNGHQYILAKQTEWAKNIGLNLIGSRGDRGRHVYTTDLDYNLFQPLLPDVKKSFLEGDGGELGELGLPGKMQALHSSSALAVNVFQYWKSIGAVHLIAAACGLCRQGSVVSQNIQFERKSPINDGFGFHPNIDVVIHNDSNTKYKMFAIECKFSEAYGAYSHGGLKQKYLDCTKIWDDIPNLRAFAKTITPDDSDFKHLHPAQLVKHILAMKRAVGRNGFRLLYLWYDVLGEQAQCHKEEITTFKKVAESDGIKFHSLTYQHLIVSLAEQFRSEHADYIRYLTGRYL